MGSVLVALLKCMLACLSKNFFFCLTLWELERRDEDKSDNVISGHPNGGDGSVLQELSSLPAVPRAFVLQLISPQDSGLSWTFFALKNEL